MIARTLMRLAELAMPPGRADWLRAMAYELPHIPPARRRAFALGCLRVSLQERIEPMTAAPPLRILPGLFGAALLAVLCLANGIAYLSSAPTVGGFLLLAAALWLAVLLAVQTQTSRGIARLAVVGAALYGAMGVSGLAGVPAFATNAPMLKALALEGIVLFAVVFAVAQIPYFWAAREKGDAEAPPFP